MDEYWEWKKQEQGQKHKQQYEIGEAASMIAG
jgi:hypothetical protein